MNVLSIQSAVTYGHVGNSAAVFALQRLGHEVWPIDTVRFSNHPGHGGLRGHASSADEIAELVDGLDERGWLAAADAVLSGYMGRAEQGPVILNAALRVKATNEQAIWLLDPVIGDHGRVFVKPGIPEFLRDHAASQADILTPNGFELAYLTGRRCERLDEAVAAAQTLRAAGKRGAGRVVVVTGLTLAGGDAGLLTNLAVSAAGAWRAAMPRLAHPANGAGDLFAALFLGRYLEGRDVARALAAATASVHAVIARSAAAGSRELLLIAAQDELVRASHVVAPLALA